MAIDFINLTPENLHEEHLCCIIRSRKPHPGVEEKRQWLAERLTEGHVFRKLREKGTVMIEYAPLESAWIPVLGENYLYLYCLWVDGRFRGHGYAKALMEYCLADAKEKGKSGVCMLGAKRQKSWLSDQSFAKKYGFVAVDATPGGFELLALSFDGSVPHFAPTAKAESINAQDLTVYYDCQCPYIHDNVALLRRFCDREGISVTFRKVDSLEEAKTLPCVFNNFAVFYRGKFQTLNLLNEEGIRRILRKFE